MTQNKQVMKLKKRIERLKLNLRIARAQLAIAEIRADPKEMAKVEKLLR